MAEDLTDRGLHRVGVPIVHEEQRRGVEAEARFSGEHVAQPLQRGHKSRHHRGSAADVVAVAKKKGSKCPRHRLRGRGDQMGWAGVVTMVEGGRRRG